jgi:hypothetical protein
MDYSNYTNQQQLMQSYIQAFGPRLEQAYPYYVQVIGVIPPTAIWMHIMRRLTTSSGLLLTHPYRNAFQGNRI